jgi:hypothetical protein
MRIPLALLLAAAFVPPLLSAAGPPETVHIVYHVQPGKVDEFLKAVAEQYPACVKLGLVLATPHLVMTGKEDGGKPVVIEVLTWRDGDAPDSVPPMYPQILAIWNRMHALVEKRGGRPGIEIDPVEVVGEASAR